MLRVTSIYLAIYSLYLAPVVQRLDNVIGWINSYPLVKC